MIQRNRADQDVKAGEVFVKGIEKTGVRDFGFCERRESPVLQGRKRLRDEERGSGDQRMALWLILRSGSPKWKFRIGVSSKEVVACPTS
jgi:hypothetical protein